MTREKTFAVTSATVCLLILTGAWWLFHLVPTPRGGAGRDVSTTASRSGGQHKKPGGGRGEAEAGKRVSSALPVSRGRLPGVAPPAVKEEEGRDEEALSGRVLEASTLLPIPGAVVALARWKGPAGGDSGRHAKDGPEAASHSPEEETSLTTRSAPSGEFRIPVPRGSFFAVRVHHEGFAAWRAAPVRAGDPLPVLLSRPESVEVLVLDPQGDPVEGAEVELRLGVRSTEDEWIPRGEARTDGRGLARIEGLGPGEHWLTAWHPDYRPYQHPDGVTVPRESREPIRIQLERWFHLVGIVRDEATGLGVVGATVRLGQSMGTLETRTVAGGRFRLLRSAEAASYLRVFAEGYAERWLDVLGDVLPGARVQEGNVEVEVPLRRSAVAAIGQVITPVGAAVEGASLLLSRSMPSVDAETAGESWEEMRVGTSSIDGAWSWRAAGASGAGGRFRIEGMEEHRDYQLIVRHPRMGAAFLTFRTPPGGSAIPLDLQRVVLVPQAALFGQVRDERDRIVPGALIWVVPRFDEAPEPHGWLNRPVAPRITSAGPAGWFALESLWPGDYDIQIGDAPPQPLHLDPAEDKGPLTFRVRRAVAEGLARTSWKILCADLEGHPLEGILVAGTYPEREEWMLEGRTGAGGTVSFEAPSGASALLVAWDPEGRFRQVTLEVPEVDEIPSGILEVRLSQETAAGRVIEGEVLSEEGQPLERIQVAIVPEAFETVLGDARAVCFTDRDGRFTLPAAEGSYRLEILDRRGLHAPAMVAPVRPGEGPIEIRLEQAPP